MASVARGRRVMGGTATNPDGSLLTAARETDEGSLVITVTGPSTAWLVRVGWTLLLPHAVGPSRWLVTPLAPTRQGCSAQYDVGDVRAALAVEVRPACLVGLGDPDPSEVDTAFTVVQYGSARRAWLAALRRGTLPAGIHERVLAHLRAENDIGPVRR